jgi:hypothetical protein
MMGGCMDIIKSVPKTILEVMGEDEEKSTRYKKTRLSVKKT